MIVIGVLDWVILGYPFRTILYNFWPNMVRSHTNLRPLLAFNVSALSNGLVDASSLAMAVLALVGIIRGPVLRRLRQS